MVELITMETLCKQVYNNTVQQQRLNEKTSVKTDDATVRSALKDAEANGNDSPRLNLHKNSEWLRTKYWDEGLSLAEIGRLVNRDTLTILRHMQRMRIERRPAHGPSGEKHGNWKGGVYRAKNNGYVYLTVENHPRTYRKRVQEHVLVMEKMIGHYLEPGEIVHHINGIKNDNRPENLKLLGSESEHQQYEDKHNRFAKAVLFGNLAPHLKEELQKLFHQAK